MNEIKTHFITEEKLPLVVEPEGKSMSLADLCTLLNAKNQWFKDQMLTYGGILLRNFPIQSPDDFSAVIKALDTGKSLHYIGGDSPRTIVKEGIILPRKLPLPLKSLFTMSSPLSISTPRISIFAA